MSRRSSASIAANPVLIGAATLLVVVVAVFLAYNANSGLPFVPTYSVNLDVPNAAQLVRGNEVRLGGTRIGVVQDITPIRRANGAVAARLSMDLETSVQPLPIDSTAIIRPRSALGLKYVELTKGSASKGFEDGATIPLSQAKPQPVEIDEVFNMFDDRTRAAAQTNLTEFGNALTGRGQDLNNAIGALEPLFVNLRPVARNLSDQRTGLGRLFRALGRTAAQVAPVAEQQGDLFSNLDRTFGSLAQVSGPIQESITTGPPTLQAGAREFPRQRPFLANSQAFFRELRPGTRALATAAPDLADAFVAGTPVLRRSIALNRRLTPTFQTLQRFAQDPLVALGLDDLTSTAQIARPTLAYLDPVQSVCNYVTLLFRNGASIISEGDANGTAQRFIQVVTPQGPNNEGSPSSRPASGGGEGDANFLHANPYPNTASPGQTQECEAANEPYLRGRVLTQGVPGNQGTLHDETKRAGR
jgi:virulence factor Mce-like protein